LLKDALNDKKFRYIPKNRLMPWGWSPAAHKLLSPLKSSCSEEFLSSPVSEWNPIYRDLYSKKFALEINKKLLSNFSSEIFLPEQQMAKICVSKQDFENAISQWGKIMVKAPWSASGRGLQPITKTPVHPKVWEKIMGIVNEQGYAIAEPFLDKIFDIAFLFGSKKEKISFIGYSYFITDKKGQYKGNYINGLPDNIGDELKFFIKKVKSELVYPLVSVLEKSRLTTEYEGFLGVDMLIYLNDNQELKLNPCLEINVRQNMGLLSLKLRNLISEEKSGIFKIFYIPGMTFLDFKSEMENKYPLHLKNNRIESGFIALTEAGCDRLFGAYLLVI
jgi:hypothetical protein